MLFNHHKYLLAVVVTLTFIWGCDSQVQNEERNEELMLLNAEIVDERLVFESKGQLNDEVQQLKNMPRESFEKVLSSAYHSGFIPVVPIVNNSDRETVELLETKMAKTVKTKSWTTTFLNEDENATVEFEDIISDESFASLINGNGEIQVADTIYKYTDIGLFFVHKDHLNHLYDFLDSNSSREKVVPSLKAKSSIIESSTEE